MAGAVTGIAATIAATSIVAYLIGYSHGWYEHQREHGNGTRAARYHPRGHTPPFRGESPVAERAGRRAHYRR